MVLKILAHSITVIEGCHFYTVFTAQNLKNTISKRELFVLSSTMGFSIKSLTCTNVLTHFLSEICSDFCLELNIPFQGLQARHCQRNRK
jgi:hypothetical protein